MQEKNKDNNLNNNEYTIRHWSLKSPELMQKILHEQYKNFSKNYKVERVSIKTKTYTFLFIKWEIDLENLEETIIELKNNLEKWILQARDIDSFIYEVYEVKSLRLGRYRIIITDNPSMDFII